MMPKDLFSEQSEVYAKYRPTYPPELFDYIFQFVETNEHAWDCATGNGQAAIVLAGHFKKVDASDISEAQIINAIHKENIRYHICPAEKTPFPDNSFDLITVAQAYHWMNWKKFHDEATRVAKQNAVVAIWGYNLFSSEDERLNKLLHHFYYDIIGPYWDRERKYVDEAYKTVEFNFDPLPQKDFALKLTWTKEQFSGYLQSWSAVQHYIKKETTSPLDIIGKELHSIWDDQEQKAVRFPVFLRMGRIRK